MSRASGVLLDKERREQETLEQQERGQEEREQMPGLHAEPLEGDLDLLTLLIRLARKLL